MDALQLIGGRAFGNIHPAGDVRRRDSLLQQKAFGGLGHGSAGLATADDEVAALGAPVATRLPQLFQFRGDAVARLNRCNACPPDGFRLFSS